MLCECGDGSVFEHGAVVFESVSVTVVFEAVCPCEGVAVVFDDCCP